MNEFHLTTPLHPNRYTAKENVQNSKKYMYWGGVGWSVDKEAKCN